jgi:hypothetical protein
MKKYFTPTLKMVELTMSKINMVKQTMSRINMAKLTNE